MNIRVVTALLLFVVVAPCFGQDTLELDKRNGFKDIHLNAPIDSVTGYKLIKEFKEKDEFPAKLYEVVNPLYEKIGEVNVDKIELKTYKDMVYEIRVLADKDPRLMKALESLYGKADYDIKNETYFWKSDKLILKFHAASKHKLEMLYISYGLHKMMKADKDKKVDDIANDF